MTTRDPFYAEWTAGAIAFIASRRHPSYIPADHSPRVPEASKAPVSELGWRRVRRNARLSLIRYGHPGVLADESKHDVRELWKHDPALAMQIAEHNGWISTPASLPAAA